MKRTILEKPLRTFKNKPEFLRKLKGIVALGLVTFFLLGGLLIWAGISAVDYVATKANHLVMSQTTQQQIENLKLEVKSITKLQALSCWGKAQSLLAVEPWVTYSISENFKNLKVACLEEKPATCNGPECSQMKKIINTAEGSLI
jgi:hypothetical protein